MQNVSKWIGNFGGDADETGSAQPIFFLIRLDAKFADIELNYIRTTHASDVELACRFDKLENSRFGRRAGATRRFIRRNINAR